MRSAFVDVESTSVKLHYCRINITGYVRSQKQQIIPVTLSQALKGCPWNFGLIPIAYFHLLHLFFVSFAHSLAPPNGRTRGRNARITYEDRGIEATCIRQTECPCFKSSVSLKLHHNYRRGRCCEVDPLYVTCLLQ